MMNDPGTPKPERDTPPSPERDTSRKGREEEVINQQDGDEVTNSDSNTVVNGTSGAGQHDAEKQFKEGTFDNTVKLDGVDNETIEGSDRTGGEETGIPGTGI